ncbi:ABC transporter permease [Paenibacillus sp. N3.4]|uniref:ABC transporter permease n=1 Tax=Paenibacillus sp. N3.4 TaxID=2603222 RepID=UPI0016504F0D|nr:ABC transporter permease [Paenibacillus sp. N3.4]
MTSNFQLFTRRIRSDWHYQYRALRTAVDWIIAIYFVIPLLIVAGYQYYSWWQTQPSWFSWLPLPLVTIVLYIFTWLGTIRYFVEEGDQLFLRQNDHWFKQLMVLGYRYSLVLQGATTLFLLAVFLPLLIKTFSFSPLEVLSLYLLTYLLKLNLGLARQLLAIHVYGIFFWLIRIAAFVGLFFLYEASVAHLREQVMYSWLEILLLLVLLVIQTRVRLRQKGAFFADVTRESHSRMRIVSIMLIQVVRRKPKPTRKHPVLFRRSQRLFRGTGANVGLSDFLAKSFFRNGTQWKMTIQFVIVISAAMFIMPGPIKIIVWILMACLLAYWRKLFCKEELTAPFLRLFHLSDKAKLEALQTTIPVLVLPALIFISLCLGISFFTWWGPILMVAAAFPLAYGTSSVFTSWY